MRSRILNSRTIKAAGLCLHKPGILLSEISSSPFTFLNLPSATLMKEEGNNCHHEEEAVFHLFDQKWFAGNILLPSINGTEKPPPSPPPQLEKPRTINSKIPIPDHPLGPVGNHSLPEHNTPFSPDSVLPSRRLETILSRKTSDEEEGDATVSTSRVIETGSPVKFRPPRVRRKAWRGRRGSRSLSELEFEEVKGFKDLGFVFPPAADVSPALAKIVPGLQRLGGPPSTDSGGLEEPEDGRRRPYLSEAWESHGGWNCPLQGWRLPEGADGNDMKESLRMWAHRIGSAVK